MREKDDLIFTEDWSLDQDIHLERGLWLLITPYIFRLMFYLNYIPLRTHLDLLSAGTDHLVSLHEITAFTWLGPITFFLFPLIILLLFARLLCSYPDVRRRPDRGVGERSERDSIWNKLNQDVNSPFWLFDSDRRYPCRERQASWTTMIFFGTTQLWSKWKER